MALRKILKQKDTPESIAGGAALGMFVALTPTVGIQMILAVILATIIRVNKIVAALMCWITNPLTIAPIFYGCYCVGALILPSYNADGVWQRFQLFAERVGEFSFMRLWWSLNMVIGEIGKLGADIAWPLLVGSLIMATVLSLITYPITLRAVRLFQKRREKLAQKWRARKADTGDKDPDRDRSRDQKQDAHASPSAETAPNEAGEPPSPDTASDSASVSPESSPGKGPEASPEPPPT
jgi:uncharacterized protein (DUF2062 family)